MLRRLRGLPRGQAVVETAIMMPLFLLGLFGVFWTVRQSALTERMQLGVRYGGTVTAMHDAFLSYSLYAMYATLDGAPPLNPHTNHSDCSSGSTASVTSSRNAWWQPFGAVTTSCFADIETIDGATQKMLLENDFISMSADAPVDAYLSTHALGRTQTPVSAEQNFFRSPDVGSLVSCTTIGNAIKNSLEGENDPTTTILPPTPIPTQMTINSIIGATQSCLTYSPVYLPPVATPNPTIAPTQSPTPTQAPTASPVPTPVKPPCTGGNTTNCTPTAAPTAVPTPVPTAKPPCNNGNVTNCIPTAIPTVVPTAIPTPTGTCLGNGNNKGEGKGDCLPSTPSPSPSPPPATPSPKPTPTPTPNPSGTPPPGAVG